MPPGEDSYPNRKRLIIFGLDGGTENVLGLADANCPTLDGFRKSGAVGRVISTTPPVTSAAWPSMASALHPGSHGIFDFQRTPFDRYPTETPPGAEDYRSERTFHDSTSWQGTAFWDVAGRDLQAALLGIPMTYPTWPVNGVMVSGFPLPDYTRNHVFPPGLDLDVPPILENVDHVRDHSATQLADLCHRLIDRQKALSVRYIRDQRYDVVFVVFQATDIAQHRLWKYLAMEDHPLREALIAMYRKVDTYVGEVMAELPDANILVVSDHGFQSHATHEFNTNVVLAEQGLLRPSEQTARPQPRHRMLVAKASPYARHTYLGRTIGKRAVSLLPHRMQDRLREAGGVLPSVAWGRTAAYRIPMCPPLEGILVNLRGRQPNGTISAADYEQTRARVIEALTAFRDPRTGEAAVEWAMRREDVWKGARSSDAPDVIVSLKPDYQGGAGLHRAVEPFSPVVLGKYTGVHAAEGIVRMAGPNVTPCVNLGDRSIVDVGSTIFALLGIAPDVPLDGESFADALRDLPVASPGARLVPRPGDEADPPPVYSADEEEALERSLRSLGYIE